MFLLNGFRCTSTIFNQSRMLCIVYFQVAIGVWAKTFSTKKHTIIKTWLEHRQHVHNMATAHTELSKRSRIARLKCQSLKEHIQTWAYPIGSNQKARIVYIWACLKASFNSFSSIVWVMSLIIVLIIHKVMPCPCRIIGSQGSHWEWAPSPWAILRNTRCRMSCEGNSGWNSVRLAHHLC